MAHKYPVTDFLDYSKSSNLNVYRIIPFERLVEIYTEKKLTLISPKEWQDPFEQHWMRVLYPDTEIRQEKNKSVFGLCLSKESRSDALWRIYSPNMLGVRIKINVSTLIDQLNNNADVRGRLFIGNVEYRSDKELIEISKNIVRGKAAIPEQLIKPWLNKRRAFKHEAEVRLLYATNDKEQKNNKIVKFDTNPNELITSINIDPRAPAQLSDALCQHLKQLTKMNGRHIKQSGLYKLPSALSNE